MDASSCEKAVLQEIHSPSHPDLPTWCRAAPTGTEIRDGLRLVMREHVPRPLEIDNALVTLQSKAFIYSYRSLSAGALVFKMEDSGVKLLARCGLIPDPSAKDAEAVADTVDGKVRREALQIAFDFATRSGQSVGSTPSEIVDAARVFAAYLAD